MKPPTLVLASLLLLAPAPELVCGEYPKPNVYPTSWELTFECGMPRRVVVHTQGAPAPLAYWYITYTVINNTDKEQVFLPVFELLTEDGRLTRSDFNIPHRVFEVIKQQERKPFLEPFPVITGELRLGEDQSRDGVAIWPEPTREMGHFSIFVGGLSGEAAVATNGRGQPILNAEGKPVLLRKALQLNYLIRGDEVHPGEDEVNENPRQWVMR